MKNKLFINFLFIFFIFFVLNIFYSASLFCGIEKDCSTKVLDSISFEKKLKKLIDYNNSNDGQTFDIEFLKILALGTFGAILYGILHDQVTARICIEYFNSDAVPHHKVLLDNFPLAVRNSPTLVAFIWGTVATWWVGLPLGTCLGFSSRIGSSLPKLKAKDLTKPALILFGSVMAASFFAGLVGYFLGKTESVYLLPRVRQHLPEGKEANFLYNAFSHEAAYRTGFIGGLVLIAWSLYKRHSLYKENLAEELKKLMGQRLEGL